MVEGGAAAAAWGDGLAGEAGRDVYGWLVGDWAGKVGVEDGSGVGEVGRVEPNFVLGLLAECGDSGAAMCKGEREGADTGKPLNNS